MVDSTSSINTTSPATTNSTTSSTTSKTATAGQGLITALGTGSGLDLEGLVTKMIDAERSPAEARLNLEKTQTEANISAYGSLQSTLASMQDAIKNLKSGDFFNTQSATSGDSTLYTATSDGTATPATYRVEVIDMAQANKIVSQSTFASPSATVGSGTMTIGVAGGKSFSVSVGASDTLTTIRDNINKSTGNIGVTASLITVDAGLNNGSTVTQLMLTSNNSGKANQLNISVTDTGDGDNTDNLGLSRFYFNGALPLDAGNRMKQIDAAQDARIAIDGFTAYSSTNTFNKVISGVTINLLKGSNGAATPPSANLLISTDKTAVKGEIQGFVAIYNTAVGVLDKLTSYNPATKVAGLLNGDSTVANIKQQIRNSIFGTVSGSTGGLNSLAMLGITTNADGTLTADDTKLGNAINSNYKDIANLFSGSSGVATKLNSTLTNVLSTTNGSLGVRQSGFQSRLKDIDNRTTQLNDRLNKEEATLRSQFAALDKLVQQLNQTSSFLQQQFNPTSKSK